VSKGKDLVFLLFEGLFNGFLGNSCAKFSFESVNICTVGGQARVENIFRKKWKRDGVGRQKAYQSPKPSPK
jgi:hypothetical protein